MRMNVKPTDMDVLTLPCVITPMGLISVFVKMDMKGMESIVQVNITDMDVLTLPCVITPLGVICMFVKVDMKGWSPFYR